MKRAIVFAGQGSQFVGMGKDLALAFPECQALFSSANGALGFDLARLCFEGPLEELTKSDNCQPAIFVMSVVCFTALKRSYPDLDLAGMAGAQPGEWTALHVAGALSFEDTVRVLRARGRFMQEACEQQQGAMVSVMGLAMSQLETICAATGVEIANLNASDQTVLSGEKAKIQEAEKMAQAAGAKRTVVLNVAGAFHSRLMAPAAQKLEQLLGGITIQRPSAPVVSNVTGQPHGEPDEIRCAMVKQVTSPVRWVSDVEWFQRNGVKEYVECGPGKVLAGLIKRIDKLAVTHSIQDGASLEKAVSGLRGQASG